MRKKSRTEKNSFVCFVGLVEKQYLNQTHKGIKFRNTQRIFFIFSELRSRTHKGIFSDFPAKSRKQSEQKKFLCVSCWFSGKTVSKTNTQRNFFAARLARPAGPASLANLASWQALPGSWPASRPAALACPLDSSPGLPANLADRSQPARPDRPACMAGADQPASPARCASQ